MNFWRRKQGHDELDEEVRSHLAMAARERVARGDDAREAEQAARREFGNVGLVKEITEDAWGWKWLRDVAEDSRYGMRMLAKNRGFAIVAILFLSLWIALTTGRFCVVFG